MKKDKVSIFWILLGLLVPIAGIIIYFVFKEDYPKVSKTVGISSICGIILLLILYFIGIPFLRPTNRSVCKTYGPDFYYSSTKVNSAIKIECCCMGKDNVCSFDNDNCVIIKY
jgi:uncharacterized membrane protein YbhN (UPF0104 family)